MGEEDVECGGELTDTMGGRDKRGIEWLWSRSGPPGCSSEVTWDFCVTSLVLTSI